MGGYFNKYLNELIAIGYCQQSANLILTKHIQHGTLDYLIARINKELKTKEVIT
jgi:hypothetical protein